MYVHSFAWLPERVKMKSGERLRKGKVLPCETYAFSFWFYTPPQVLHTEAKYKQVQRSLNTCAKLTKCSAICAFLLFICCVEVERTIKILLAYCLPKNNISMVKLYTNALPKYLENT